VAIIVSCFSDPVARVIGNARTLCLAKTLSLSEKINNFGTISSIARFAMTMVHVQLRPAEFGTGGRCFRSRRRLLLENLALRQQLAVLKRRRARPKLSPFDKLFWVLACRFWTDWRRSLLVVTPETVVRWHRRISTVLELDLEG
jgi:hypothetical protein